MMNIIRYFEKYKMAIQNYISLMNIEDRQKNYPIFLVAYSRHATPVLGGSFEDRGFPHEDLNSEIETGGLKGCMCKDQ